MPHSGFNGWISDLTVPYFSPKILFEQKTSILLIIVPLIVFKVFFCVIPNKLSNKISFHCTNCQDHIRLESHLVRQNDRVYCNKGLIAFCHGHDTTDETMMGKSTAPVSIRRNITAKLSGIQCLKGGVSFANRFNAAVSFNFTLSTLEENCYVS